MLKILIIFFIIFFYNSVYGLENKIIIASTTSTYDTGLMDVINNKFNEKFNIQVQVLALGTGQAIRAAVDGNVELLLVHHTPSELEFMNKGYGEIRYNLMYNDFVLVGPINDTKECTSVLSKFHNIYDEKKIFITRGDDSGTHKKELELWKKIDLLPNDSDNWYLNVGQGMGMTLLIANEKKTYTLSDRSSWISFNKRDNLRVVCENDPPLFNQYGIILVSSELNNKLNVEDAKTYINWLISDEAKKIINSFKKKGEQLFFYNHH